MILEFMNCVVSFEKVKNLKNAGCTCQWQGTDQSKSSEKNDNYYRLIYLIQFNFLVITNWPLNKTFYVFIYNYAVLIPLSFVSGVFFLHHDANLTLIWHIPSSLLDTGIELMTFSEPDELYHCFCSFHQNNKNKDTSPNNLLRSLV